MRSIFFVVVVSGNNFFYTVKANRTKCAITYILVYFIDLRQRYTILIIFVGILYNLSELTTIT